MAGQEWLSNIKTMTEVLQGKKFKCSFCGGSGIQPHSLKSRCFACRGKGEVEFEGPAITCPSCKGKGRSLGALGLACIRCKGIGVIEKRGKEDARDFVDERLGEITSRLKRVRKETEKKTKEVEKRLKPVKPFIKEVKKETLWFENLGNNLKKAWESLWEK